MRSFSLVLLRRFLFRPTRSRGQAGAQPFATGGPSHSFVIDDDDPFEKSDAALQRLLRSITMSNKHIPAAQFFNRPAPPPPPVVVDDLSQDSISAIERLLLQSFVHEPAPTVRTATVESITALADHFLGKGRQWGALQEQALGMARGQNKVLRESAFKLFVRTQVLGMGEWQGDVVVDVLKGGLEDGESVAVSFIHLLLLIFIHSFVDNSWYLMTGPPRGSPRIFGISVICCCRYPSSPIRFLTLPDARNSPPSSPCGLREIHFLPEQPRHAQTRAFPTAFRSTAQFPRAAHLAEHGRGLHPYGLEAVGGQHG